MIDDALSGRSNSIRQPATGGRAIGVYLALSRNSGGGTMWNSIQRGYMVFLAEGQEGIGAVREVGPVSISVYVESFGEFVVPLDAVTSVHDQKVLLDRTHVSRKLLRAAARAHDNEDPKHAG